MLIDVGCKKDGFCADMTRTFFLGEPDEESRRVYETVLAAQLTAEEVSAWVGAAGIMEML